MDDDIFMKFLRFGLCLLCLTTLVNSQDAPLRKEPMTVKELALMIRMGMPEAEWFTELQQRKLIEPLNDEGAKLLINSGAAPAIVEKVRQSGLTLDPSAANAAQREKAEREVNAQKELEQLRLQAAATKRAQSLVPQGTAPDAMVKQLTGKLVSVSGDAWQEFDARKLSQVRYFVFYSSASWCQPCHQFTPKLIEFYQQMKPTHPEFEVILVSADKSKLNAQGYTRQYKMPWLAVNYEATPEFAEAYSGKFIPFIAIVRNDGKIVLPSSKNVFGQMRAEVGLEFIRNILLGKHPGL